MSGREMRKGPHPGNASARHRRALCVFLSFFLPFLVLTLALLVLRVTPFGPQNLVIIDGQAYMSEEAFFGRLLKGQENILYSFNNGLGGNEWSSFAWGGFSFGALLSVFGTLETLPALFTWTGVVNVSLCGLTMYLFLAGLHGHRFSHLIFSASYALMGFTVVNVYQALFLIGPQMLPLVALGLVKLVRRQSPLVYILSLACCIFINFYFGFQLCVASVLFFLTFLYVRCGELKGKVRGLFGTWAASSTVAGLLAAPMWLPALKAFSGGGRLDQARLAEYSLRPDLSFRRIFAKLFSGASSIDEMLEGMPYIFCGILALSLAVLFLLDRGIDLRRRRAAGAVLGFYLLTFCVPALTMLMHGGTHTNQLPFRYAYVFSFLLIGLAAEEFLHLDAITLRNVKKLGVALLIGAVLVLSAAYEFITWWAVLLDLALLLLMWLVFRLHRSKPDKVPRRLFSLLLLLTVSANLFVNCVLSVNAELEAGIDLDQYGEVSFTSGVLTEAISLSDDSFFRMEKDVSQSASQGVDAYLYDYNGVSHSGPTEREFIHVQLSKLGVNWFDMRHWYSEGVPAATDCLLGLKYLISERDLTEEKQYEQRADLDGTKVYLNEHALPVSILSDAAACALELGDDPFDNLNRIWRAMAGGETDIFTEVEDVTFTLHGPTIGPSFTGEELRVRTERNETDEESEASEGEYYIEFSFETVKDGPVYQFDVSTPSSVYGQRIPSIRYLGYYRAGETVTDRVNVSKADSIPNALDYCGGQIFATADNDVLAKYAETLNSREITFDPVHENDLTGTFTAEEGRRILFTIPWDEGWTCWIDGEQVPIDKTWDLFMSVEAPAGSHTYEMKFFPAWMDYGLILSGAALAGLIVLLVLERNRKTGPENGEEGPQGA